MEWKGKEVEERAQVGQIKGRVKMGGDQPR